MCCFFPSFSFFFLKAKEVLYYYNSVFFHTFLHVATSSDLGLYVLANYKLHFIIMQKPSNIAIVKLSSVENGSSSTF